MTDQERAGDAVLERTAGTPTPGVGDGTGGSPLSEPTEAVVDPEVGALVRELGETPRDDVTADPRQAAEEIGTGTDR